MSTSADKRNMYSAPVSGMEEEQDLFANFDNVFPTTDTPENEDEGDDAWNVASFAKISVVSQQETAPAEKNSCSESPSSLVDSTEEHEDKQVESEALAPITPGSSFDESEKGKNVKDQPAPNTPLSISTSEASSSAPSTPRSMSSTSEALSSSSESESLSDGDDNDEENFASEEIGDEETPKGTEGDEELTLTPTSAVSESTDVWADVVGVISENVRSASENVSENVRSASGWASENAGSASENVKSASGWASASVKAASEKFVETVTENIPMGGAASEEQESVPNVVPVESSSSSDDDDESAAKSTRSSRSLRSLLSRKSVGSRKSISSTKSGGSRKSTASRKSAGSKSSHKSLSTSFSPLLAFFGKKPTTGSAKSSSVVQKPVENKSARNVSNSNGENNSITSTPSEEMTKEKQLMKIKSVLKGLGITTTKKDGGTSQSQHETRYYKIVRKKPKTSKEISFLEELADEFFTCSYFFKCVGEDVADQGRHCTNGGCCGCGELTEEVEEDLQIDSNEGIEIDGPEKENPEPVGYFSSWTSYVYGEA